MERNTRQRQAVLDAIQRARHAMTPPEILEVACKAVPTLNLSTVYRQVGALEDEALITKVVLADQPARYEKACSLADHDADHHHHHFHCTSCDRVFPVHACPGPMQDLAPRGFKVESHDLTLHGLCADCRRTARDLSSAMPK
jgi:Fur family ferric uptake transcriptional regulator